MIAILLLAWAARRSRLVRASVLIVQDILRR